MAEKTDTEMKNLGNLRPAKGSNHQRKRLGRGIGSGLGKTAGRGHKGLGQRKSGNARPGFEGGSMPLYMRLPKRGFISPFRQHFNEVNLDSLERFAEGTAIDAKTLGDAGLLRDGALPIKLLGRGKLDKKLQITVHKASAGAKEAVEKAGGTVTVLGVEKRGEKARAKLDRKAKRKAERAAKSSS